MFSFFGFEATSCGARGLLLVLCAQDSLLMGSGDDMGIQGLNPGQSHSRQISYYPLSIAPDPFPLPPIKNSVLVPETQYRVKVLACLKCALSCTAQRPKQSQEAVQKQCQVWPNSPNHRREGRWVIRERVVKG